MMYSCFTCVDRDNDCCTLTKPADLERSCIAQTDDERE
jgi:hypothetical protein